MALRLCWWGVMCFVYCKGGQGQWVNEKTMSMSKSYVYERKYGHLILKKAKTVAR